MLDCRPVTNLWQLLYQRFDPERPALDAAERADRPRSPAEKIIRTLSTSFADSRFLLTGTVGTGKTTELHRIADQRREQELVVFLDLESHFCNVVRDPEALQHVSAWEVCFLAAIALIAEFRARYGRDFPVQHLIELTDAWKKLAKSTDTPGPADLDPGKFIGRAVEAFAKLSGLGPAVEMGAAVAAAAAQATRWQIPLGQSKRTPLDQEQEVQSLLQVINTLVGLAKHEAKRVLFVIDGLDRIRDLNKSKQLLVESNMVGQLDCPLVVCAPLAMRHDIATAAVRRFTPVVLVNEPVLNQTDPNQPGQGVEFFCQVYRRRAEAIEAMQLVPSTLCQRLAYFSGGRVRDFVASVRDLALLAHQDGLTMATPEAVEQVLEDRRRQRELGLHQDHIRLLAQIAKDPEHQLPGGPLAQELLTYGALLPYPDGSEWYYPHPLLMRRLVKTG